MTPIVPVRKRQSIHDALFPLDRRRGTRPAGRCLLGAGEFVNEPTPTLAGSVASATATTTALPEATSTEAEMNTATTAMAATSTATATSAPHATPTPNPSPTATATATEQPTATASPTSVPLTATPTTAPTATQQSSSDEFIIISRDDTSEKTVALTFDAGSDRGFAEEILDVLDAEGVAATFGMTGSWAEDNPDLIQRMVDGGLSTHEPHDDAPVLDR